MAARFRTTLLGCVAGLICGTAQAAPAAYPDDFAAAAKTQPAKPDWAQAYKPKSKRDFQGLWKNTGGITWVPKQPQGVVTPAPLTPAYAKMFEGFVRDAAAGKPTGDVTASCLPQGMPRIMTMTYPME